MAVAAAIVQRVVAGANRTAVAAAVTRVPVSAGLPLPIYSQ